MYQGFHTSLDTLFFYLLTFLHYRRQIKVKTIEADIKTYEWQTKTLELKNSELYVFAFIFNYFN